jgi:hypothetical protein
LPRLLADLVEWPKLRRVAGKRHNLAAGEVAAAPPRNDVIENAIGLGFVEFKPAW